MDAPGIPGMICVCHEKEGKGKGSVYNGGVAGRESGSGGKKSVP
jgi:hypothetical protein